MKSLRYALAAVALGAVFSVSHAEPARVPLVSADSQDPILSEAFNAIRSRGAEPGNMHRTVGHNPAIFKAYLGLATALRASAEVPRADRELMILRIAQLADAEYEFTAHRPMAISCGVTEAQIDNMNEWSKSDDYTERQRAILAFADAMASKEGMNDATFDAMKPYFSSKEIVELTMTGAFYTMASMVTDTLDIESDMGKKPSKYGAC
jgi:4-carboxymuconolactone decarboxylase